MKWRWILQNKNSCNNQTNSVSNKNKGHSETAKVNKGNLCLLAPIHSFIPSFQHNTKTFSNKTRRLSSLPIFPLFPVPIPILSINNINNTSSCLLIYFSLFPSCFTFQHLIRDDPLSLQIFFQGKVWMVREFLDYHIGNPPPCLFFFSGVIELLVFSFFLIGLFWNLFFLGSFGLSLTLIFIFIFLQFCGKS